MTATNAEFQTWFRVRGTHIDAVEVVKVNPETLMVSSKYLMGKGRKELRVAKASQYEKYFPSFDEARAYLLNYIDMSIVRLRRQLEQANGRRGQIKGMKEPTP